MYLVLTHHTNDQMYTHSYKYKTGKQFLDFIKRVDKKYDSSSVKQIFLVNWIIHQYTDPKEGKRNHTEIPSQNKLCILADKITRTKPDRNKMVMDAETSSKQILPLEMNQILEKQYLTGHTTTMRNMVEG